MKISLCVFDAYGTLFDVAAAARDAAKTHKGLAENWQTIAEDWRSKQLQYTWLRAITKSHCNFWQVTQDALDWTMERHGLDEDHALRQALLKLYWTLDAYPEIKPMLDSIRRMQMRTAILSNGSPKMLQSAVEHAGIAQLFDAILSVEEVGVFKPDSRVYSLVEKQFGCARSEVLFISSNGWDVAAASGYGFETVWANRAQDPVDHLPWKPKHILRDLSQLDTLVQNL